MVGEIMTYLPNEISSEILKKYAILWSKTMKCYKIGKKKNKIHHVVYAEAVRDKLTILRDKFGKLDRRTVCVHAYIKFT